MTPATCRNCEAPLSGPYCAQCGQHAHESARALAALGHDAWHVVTHLDSRFWATLKLLAFRPGQLTREYFDERRARYVPPVRLYLVISILFFGIASLTSLLRPDFVVSDSAGAKRFEPDLNDIKREAREAAAEARKAAAKPGAAAKQDEDGDLNFDVKDCDKIHSSLRWLEQPLRDACRRNFGDGGRTLKHAFVANIPKMMFVFLPMIALVMRLLYWWPRRYYVEHLVFFLHNHAALFLAMSVQILYSALARLVPALKASASWLGFAVLCYAVWYVYRSLRRYYGQGRWLTLVKLTIVGFAYLAFLGITLVGTLLVSALVA